MTKQMIILWVVSIVLYVLALYGAYRAGVNTGKLSILRPVSAYLKTITDGRRIVNGKEALDDVLNVILGAEVSEQSSEELAARQKQLDAEQNTSKPKQVTKGILKYDVARSHGQNGQL